MEARAPEDGLTDDEWKRALAKENPALAWVRVDVEQIEEGETREWHGTYLRAFDLLQADRSYGAMSGEGPIHYTAMSRYASDHEITGEDWILFKVFINALDTEYLKVREELSRAGRNDAGAD